ncbi:MAG: helix-turn-helix transcriptional regulator [Clostridia bacterium]|nr:helix-turn-helix transcriptional regulator [Clostridia bacterium]
MGKKAGETTQNSRYYTARVNEENGEKFSSREKASEALGIDRTRLARIENGNVIPHPDEIAVMTETYNDPELSNYYCSEVCPLGQGRVVRAEMGSLDRITLQLLGSLQNASRLTDMLVRIAEDGRVDPSEKEAFGEVLALLDQIRSSFEALRLWAEKNT